MTYLVTATGNTFRVKEELKEWGFTWDNRPQAWVRRGATQGEANMFKSWARGVEWEGVELSVLEEKTSAAALPRGEFDV